MRGLLSSVSALVIASTLSACSPFQSGMKSSSSAKPTFGGQSYSAVFAEPQPGSTCNDLTQGKGPDRVYGCTTHLEIVADVYRQLLWREPDAAGVATWTQYLAQGHSKAELEAEVRKSVEYQQKWGGMSLVYSSFANLFDRLPTDDEAINWQNWAAVQFASGRSLGEFGPELVRHFMSQGEFQAKFPGVPATGYEALVADIYWKSFGREPSPEESARWSNHLLTATLLGMYTELAHSDESFLAANYRALLGRNPDPIGRETFLSYLSNGGDRNEVLRAIQNSPERRSRYQTAGFFHLEGAIFYSNGQDAYCLIPTWERFLQVGGAADLSNVDMTRPGLPVGMRNDGVCQ